MYRAACIPPYTRTSSNYDPYQWKAQRSHLVEKPRNGKWPRSSENTPVSMWAYVKDFHVGGCDRFCLLYIYWKYNITVSLKINRGKKWPHCSDFTLVFNIIKHYIIPLCVWNLIFDVFVKFIFSLQREVIHATLHIYHVRSKLYMKSKWPLRS